MAASESLEGTQMTQIWQIHADWWLSSERGETPAAGDRRMRYATRRWHGPRI